MESNTTPPKEIYLLGQDLEFMVNDSRKELYYIDASLTDVLGRQVKYLSEQSVKEMLAEKDKEIERLKSEVKELKITKSLAEDIVNSNLDTFRQR